MNNGASYNCSHLRLNALLPGRSGLAGMLRVCMCNSDPANHRTISQTRLWPSALAHTYKLISFPGIMNDDLI
jgi:hypothetical protein